MWQQPKHIAAALKGQGQAFPVMEKGDVAKSIMGFDVVGRFNTNPSPLASDFTSFSQHAGFVVTKE